jgi:hypothetical protein
MPGLKNVWLVADTEDEEMAKRIEAAAKRAGVEIVRFDPPDVPPGGAREFIATAGWKATTSDRYAHIPHEYTVRGQAVAGKTMPPPTAWHDWFRNLIRTEGYTAEFSSDHGKTFYKYKYLHVDGYKYWSFRFIINREKLPEGEK